MAHRFLTLGEISEARRCFSDKVKYSIIKVHNEPWSMLQPERTAMSPDGQIYFHPGDFLNDFSKNVEDMAWLIHEIGHCWQHQQGQWVMVRGAFEREYRYGALDPKIPFKSYKIEQQAAIFEDYYRIINGLKARRGSGTRNTYEAVIPTI